MRSSHLLLSDKFTEIPDLFAWKLIGDVLKVGAYVFDYLVIGKDVIGFSILMKIS